MLKDGGNYLAMNSPQRIIVVGGLTSNIVDNSCDNVEVWAFPMVAFSDTVCWSTSRGVTFLDRCNQTGPTLSIQVFIDVPGEAHTCRYSSDIGVVFKETP